MPGGAAYGLDRTQVLNRHQEMMLNLPGKAVIRKTVPRFASGPLDVNVIFTDPEATAVALRFAQSLACELGACIRMRAAIAVPLRLPLDESPVSVTFLEGTLRKLVSQVADEGFYPTLHLYLCRDRVQALSLALKPNSLVVIGGRKRWWPTAESQLAKALRSKGHRVIYVDSKAKSPSKQPAFVR